MHAGLHVTHHCRLLPPLDHVDAVLVEDLVAVDGIGLVLLEPVLHRLDDARRAHDVAQRHDPVVVEIFDLVD